jgi:hypothetical protein
MAAMQLVVLLVLTTIAGAGLFIYAAHVFVTIAQQTSGGLDEIAWPKDPWHDWIVGALHLAWLVAFWLVPLGILFRLIGPTSLAASAALHVGLPAALFWLLFPITLLSSFSANSAWVLVRPEALGRMARGASATFAFYLISAPLCLAGAVTLYIALAGPTVYALPVLATVLFLYARLIGRYSRVLGRVSLKKGGKPRTDPDVRRAAKAAKVEDPWGTPPEAEKKERPRKKKKKPTVTVQDPWAIPEEPATADPEQGEDAETYGIAKDAPAPRQAESQKPPPVEGYDVSPKEQPRPPKDEVPIDGAPPVEPKRILSEGETPLPAWPLVNGVFPFPWYRANLGTWAALTLMFLGWAYLYATMQDAAGILK